MNIFRSWWLAIKIKLHLANVILNHSSRRADKVFILDCKFCFTYSENNTRILELFSTLLCKRFSKLIATTGFFSFIKVQSSGPWVFFFYGFVILCEQWILIGCWYHIFYLGCTGPYVYLYTLFNKFCLKHISIQLYERP